MMWNLFVYIYWNGTHSMIYATVFYLSHTNITTLWWYFDSRVVGHKMLYIFHCLCIVSISLDDCAVHYATGECFPVIPGLTFVPIMLKCRCVDKSDCSNKFSPVHSTVCKVLLLDCINIYYFTVKVQWCCVL